MPNTPLNKKPTLPPSQVAAWDLQARAQELRNLALSCGDPEMCQAAIKGIDDILKNIADTQKAVGISRVEASKHCQLLRLASPKKGKPEDGTIKDLGGGRQLVFFDSAWHPYTDVTSKQEK